MENSFSKIISKIWEDPKFKEEFMKNPRFFLQNEGIEIPENVNVIVHENTENEIHLIIPQEPIVELTDNELKAMAGGTGINITRDEVITKDEIKNLYDRLYGKK